MMSVMYISSIFGNGCNNLVMFLFSPYLVIRCNGLNCFRQLSPELIKISLVLHRSHILEHIHIFYIWHFSSE